MQINGAPLATAFAPKSLDLQEQARKPVTIDATSSFKLEQETSAQAGVNSRVVQAEITVNDGQQARFVRFFATNDEASSNSSQSSSSVRPLPQAVQQYIQIADLENQPNQRYLDEIV